MANPEVSTKCVMVSPSLGEVGVPGEKCKRIPAETCPRGFEEGTSEYLLSLPQLWNGFCEQPSVYRPCAG